MASASSRRLILAAAGAALLVRLAFGFFYWTGKPLTHDEREYLGLAASLASGQGFRYPEAADAGTSPRFGRAPGYPAFLSLFRPAADAADVPSAIKAAQAALVAVAVLLLAAIARRAAGDEAAVAAAWIAAFYPPLVWISAYALSEALYVPLALGCTILLARAERPGAAFAAGVVAGVAILVRPATLVFMPLAALWFLRQRRLALAVALTAGTLLAVLPWTLRNVQTHGRLVLVASEGGVTFWTGNHPLARGEGDMAANPELKAAEIAFRTAQGPLTPEELEPLYYRDALRHIADRPGWWLTLVARKAFYTVVPAGPSYTLHSTKYLLATVIPYAMLVPLALAGFVWIARHGRPPVFLYLLGASVVLTSLIFFPQERFRIPVIDPLVIVGAGAALAALRSERR